MKEWGRKILWLSVAAGLFLVGCRESTKQPPVSAAFPGAGIQRTSDRPGTTDGETGGSVKYLGKALKVFGGYPYDDPVVFMVNGRPVTKEELDRFEKRYLTMHGHTEHEESSTDNIIRSFAYFWTVVEKGVDDGIADDPAVRNIVRVYRNTALANDYRKQLEDSIRVPEGDVERPSDWVRIDFAIRTFGSDEEADSTYKTLQEIFRTGGAEPLERKIREMFKSTTGPIFPGSGFFEPEDDAYLFTLRKGMLSRPIHTGIGLGICYVLFREDMGAKAVEQYLAGAKKKKIDEEVEATIQGILKKHPHSVHEKNLLQSVLEEGREGSQQTLVVLSLRSSSGEISVRYNDFRHLVPQNYAVLFRSYPASTWVNFVRPDLENLAGLFAIGEEAKRRNVSLSGRWKKEMFDFHAKMVYFGELESLLERQKVQVDEGEVRRYYDSNRGLFSRKEMVKVTYFYHPEKGALDSLVKAAGTKKKLWEKKEYAGRVKLAFLERGDRTHPELFRKLEPLGKGEISDILKADMGYYLVRVEDRRKKGFSPYEEVRGIIRHRLEEEKKRERGKFQIDQILKEVEIRKVNGNLAR